MSKGTHSVGWANFFSMCGFYATCQLQMLVAHSRCFRGTTRPPGQSSALRLLPLDINDFGWTNHFVALVVPHWFIDRSPYLPAAAHWLDDCEAPVLVNWSVLDLGSARCFTR